VLLGWLALAHRWGAFRPCRALAAGLVAASLALLALRGTGRAPDALSLEAVDVGQGDALLLRVPGGEATLVDTGPGPWAARRLVRVLSRRGLREPLHLLLTHPHSDHAGGWGTLARLWPPASTGLPAMADAAEAWAPWRSGREGLELQRDDAWMRGAADFSVRWPPKAYRLPDANMVSLVLRVRLRDRELWLMGDALEPQERDLMDLGDPGPGRAHRLLKAGHHGSRSSSCPPWIRALGPELALLTAGRRNRFGHPHEEALGALRAAGVPEPWVVGSCAGVRVEAVPGGWLVETGAGVRTFMPLRALPTP
jgi:competence protein ComEC